jgi:rhodanese-related sulfurtransferase
LEFVARGRRHFDNAARMLRPVWERVSTRPDVVVVFHCASGMVRSAALRLTKLGIGQMGIIIAGIGESKNSIWDF